MSDPRIEPTPPERGTFTAPRFTAGYVPAVSGWAVSDSAGGVPVWGLRGPDAGDAAHHLAAFLNVVIPQDPQHSPAAWEIRRQLGPFSTLDPE